LSRLDQGHLRLACTPCTTQDLPSKVPSSYCLRRNRRVSAARGDPHHSTALCPQTLVIPKFQRGSRYLGGLRNVHFASAISNVANHRFSQPSRPTLWSMIDHPVRRRALTCSLTILVSAATCSAVQRSVSSCGTNCNVGSAAVPTARRTRPDVRRCTRSEGPDCSKSESDLQQGDRSAEGRRWDRRTTHSVPSWSD
jgi:hypothetical protein